MPIDTDDLEPTRKKAAPTDLSAMSVAELQQYIATLEVEIERARAAIAAKDAQRSVADALFKR